LHNLLRIILESRFLPCCKGKAQSQ
jgi:hypothetical protein